jgi:hypothetical protein
VREQSCATIPPLQHENSKRDSINIYLQTHWKMECK